MNPKIESKKKNTLPTRFAFQHKKLNSKLEQNQQNYAFNTKNNYIQTILF